MSKQTAIASTASELIRARTPRAKSTKETAKPAPKTPKTPKVETKAAPAPAPQAPAANPNANPFGPEPSESGLKLTHAIKSGFTPSAGAALFAHTAVFLTHARLDKTPMPTATVDAFIGTRAIAYHMSKGNFTKVGDTRTADGKVIRGGIVLTSKGRELFMKRREDGIDAELFSAFENVLCRGEADDRVIKNAALLVQIASK